MRAIVTLPVRDHINGALRAALEESGLPWLPIYQMSDLPRARSLLLTAALQHEPDVIVCIDADVVPTAQQIRQLSTHPRLGEQGAVTGLYPRRSGKGWAVYAPEPAEPDGCRPAIHAGLGFAAITAASLRRVRQRLPRLVDPEVGEWWCFCLPFIDETGASPEYRPEDYSLWQRLAESGTQLWADTKIIVGHQTLFTLRSPIEEAELGTGASLDQLAAEVDGRGQARERHSMNLGLNVGAADGDTTERLAHHDQVA